MPGGARIGTGFTTRSALQGIDHFRCCWRRWMAYLRPPAQRFTRKARSACTASQLANRCEAAGSHQHWCKRHTPPHEHEASNERSSRPPMRAGQSTRGPDTAKRERSLSSAHRPRGHEVVADSGTTFGSNRIARCGGRTGLESAKSPRCKPAPRTPESQKGSSPICAVVPGGVAAGSVVASRHDGLGRRVTGPGDPDRSSGRCRV